MLNFLALCSQGLEKLVKDELKALGYPVTLTVSGKVFFSAPWEGIYKTNLWLRTAENVIWIMGEFPAGDFDQLFEGVRALPWKDVVPPHAPVVIEKARTYKSKLTSLPTLQAMTQKAVYQSLGRSDAPSSPGTLIKASQTLNLRLYLEHDRALVGINTTGDSLHKRGYRRMTSSAPIKETLAAAMLLFSGWRRKNALVDPFCGSGTILMEALLFGLNIPPGLNRSFAFEHLGGFQKLDWQILKDEAREKIVLEHPVKLFGSDKDPNVIYAAKANAQAMGFEDKIHFEVLPMEQARCPEEGGFIITNPPYGERLETKEQARVLMSQLRGWERRFPGYRLGVISPLEDISELLGKEPFMKRPLHNGALEVNYWQFV